jgi:hypothetical protein
VLGPQDPGGGQLATVMMSDASDWLRAELFTPRDELDEKAEPVTLVTPSGSSMNLSDVMSSLDVARNEHRRVVIEIQRYGDA